MRRGIGAVLAAGCVAAFGSAAPVPKGIRSAEEVVKAKLQGTWVLVSREEGGRLTEAADDSSTFTVSGDTWVWKYGEGVMQQGTFKLTDLTKTPKQWEYAVAGGGVGYSICEVGDDGFKYCSTGSPDTRPTEFCTKPGDGRYCCVWKRAAK